VSSKRKELPPSRAMHVFLTVDFFYPFRVLNVVYDLCSKNRLYRHEHCGYWGEGLVPLLLTS